MFVASWRHAENYKKLVGFQAHNEPENTSGRPVAPIITPMGSANAGAVAMAARTGVMQNVKDVFIASSDWERAKTTSCAGFSAFSHPAFGPQGSKVTQLNFSELDAKTADDYFSVFHFLQNIAEFCATNKLEEPQAAIIITHAHNILGHLLERFLDKDFATYTPEEANFLDDIIDNFQFGEIGFLQNAMDNGEYEKFRAELTHSDAGHKPEYSEMRVFDMAQQRHVKTFKPPWIDYAL